MKTSLTDITRTDDSVTVWRSVGTTIAVGNYYIITHNQCRTSAMVVALQDAGAMCYLKSDRKPWTAEPTLVPYRKFQERY